MNVHFVYYACFFYSFRRVERDMKEGWKKEEMTCKHRTPVGNRTHESEFWQLRAYAMAHLGKRMTRLIVLDGPTSIQNGSQTHVHQTQRRQRFAYVMCSVDVTLVQCEPLYVRITRYAAVLRAQEKGVETLGNSQHSTYTNQSECKGRTRLHTHMDHGWAQMGMA